MPIGLSVFSSIVEILRTMRTICSVTPGMPRSSFKIASRPTPSSFGALGCNSGDFARVHPPEKVPDRRGNLTEPRAGELVRFAPSIFGERANSPRWRGPCYARP